MAPELHDLVAPYALGALDPEERLGFERHLDDCERCREELALLGPAAGALAYATEAREPPPELRDRILAAARANGVAKVIPFPRRPWLLPAAATAAAVAAVAAVAIGIWSVSLSRDLNRERNAKSDYARAVELLGKGATVTPLAAGEGSLVVAPDGRAALLACNLETAPKNKTYEAWVMQGAAARPAGLFRGGVDCSPVLLEARVPQGAQVGVTLEEKGGVQKPTGRVIVRSENV